MLAEKEAECVNPQGPVCDLVNDNVATENIEIACKS